MSTLTEYLLNAAPPNQVSDYSVSNCTHTYLNNKIISGLRAHETHQIHLTMDQEDNLSWAREAGNLRVWSRSLAGPS